MYLPVHTAPYSIISELRCKYFVSVVACRHNRNMCEYTFSYKENPLLGAGALQMCFKCINHDIPIGMLGRYQPPACRIVSRWKQAQYEIKMETGCTEKNGDTQTKVDQASTSDTSWNQHLFRGGTV